MTFYSSVVGQFTVSGFIESYREFSRFSVSILHLLARRMSRAAIKL